MVFSKRESVGDRERRIAEESRQVIILKWQAYKAIMASPHSTFSIGDARLYKSVRQRLKSMFHGDTEKLSRFKLVRDA